MGHPSGCIRRTDTLRDLRQASFGAPTAQAYLGDVNLLPDMGAASLLTVTVHCVRSATGHCDRMPFARCFAAYRTNSLARNLYALAHSGETGAPRCCHLALRACPHVRSVCIPVWRLRRRQARNGLPRLREGEGELPMSMQEHVPLHSARPMASPLMSPSTQPPGQMCKMNIPCVCHSFVVRSTNTGVGL